MGRHIGDSHRSCPWRVVPCADNSCHQQWQAISSPSPNTSNQYLTFIISPSWKIMRCMIHIPVYLNSKEVNCLYYNVPEHVWGWKGYTSHQLFICSFLGHEWENARYHLFNCYWHSHILGYKNSWSWRNDWNMKEQTWHITKTSGKKSNLDCTPGMYGDSVTGTVNRSTMTTPTGNGGRNIRMKSICEESIWSWQLVYKFDYRYYHTYSTHTHTHTCTNAHTYPLHL